METDETTTVRRLRDIGRAQWEYEHRVVNLIASDNAAPIELMRDPVYPGLMIQEGLRGKRPFAGARLHDEIEELAETIACEVFGAAAANLQPHSCSQANQAVYHALLEPGDTVLALGFQAGGHLTHGLRINFSGRLYRFVHYGLDAHDLIDYDEVMRLANEHQPRLIVCGSSSYPRLFDAERLRAVADACGARLMFDLSHEAGLIASGAIPNPVPFADVTTMSLDKTLRGPFGAVVLSTAEVAADIARAVHPGTQSSFSVRRIADSAHALALTRTEAFREYGQRVLSNASTLASTLLDRGFQMVSGGTDKHYLVLDVRKSVGLSGQDAEERLEAIDVLSSRQSLPLDTSARGSEAGGIRFGTAWVTSRGYESHDMSALADIVASALRGSDIDENRSEIARLVAIKRPKDVWAQLDPTESTAGWIAPAHA